MHFVFDQVRQLQHVGVANRDRLIKGLARATVEQLDLARLRQTGAAQVSFDILFRGAVEDRGSDLHPQCSSGPAQVCFHDLPDVHAVRHTERVQNDVDRRAVREVWHILDRQHTGDDSLVAVPSGHLVTGTDLAFLGNTDTHPLVDPRRQLIASLAREHLDLDNRAALAVRHTQRGIFYLAGLLTEDGTQQLFLGRRFRLALGGDPAHQDVLRPYLGTHIDDAVLIEVAQSFLADVGNI